MKYLIVGLGNPGPEYELNRHNIGFLVLDRLADKFDADFESARYGNIATIKYKSRSLALVKPSTYMNESGKAVNYWMNANKVSKENLLIVVDDIALPFGSLRMRQKGASAGHNGLKSIESHIGGPDYPRLRFGIGNDFGPGQQSDYVLSNFNHDEFDSLTSLIDKVCDCILSFTTIGITRTMNVYND